VTEYLCWFNVAGVWVLLMCAAGLVGASVDRRRRGRPAARSHDD